MRVVAGVNLVAVSVRTRRGPGQIDAGRFEFRDCLQSVTLPVERVACRPLGVPLRIVTGEIAPWPSHADRLGKGPRAG
jgi:hypothetical protein